MAGAVTGNIHLVGGSLATIGTAWLLSRPRMADPRRVVWLLAGGIGLATIPSIFAYWTHSLWMCKLMFWLFIPAIYFYIGPCFGLLNNLAPCHMRNMFIAVSLLVANIFNLMVAPWVVGVLSDWFAGAHGTDACIAAPGIAGFGPHGILGGVSSVSGVQDHRCGSESAPSAIPRPGLPDSWAKPSSTAAGCRLNALRAFEGVAKHSSFTAAANALLISQSALSRHVIALEKLIGAQLFERKPHALVLTKAGQHLLPAVMKSFDRLEYALDDIRNDGATTLRTLRVQMPPSFAVHLAVPILRDFRRAAAEVEIDLVSPYGVGPPPSDVDVAVVYSKPTVTDLVTDLLWPVRLSLLCHPNVAARHAGKTLAEFIEANELVHVRISDQPRHHLWTQFARQSNLGVAECGTRIGFRHRHARGAVCAERRGHRTA